MWLEPCAEVAADEAASASDESDSPVRCDVLPCGGDGQDDVGDRTGGRCDERGDQRGRCHGRKREASPHQNRAEQ